MADFISDPSVAAAIDDLKCRWPAIGRAAEIPLTEHFLQHQRRRIPWRVLLPNLNGWSSSVMWIWLILFLWSQSKASRLIILIGIVPLMLVRLVGAIDTIAGKRRRHARNLRDVSDLLRDNDPRQLDQLNLAGLHFTDLLAACAACSNNLWRRCAVARAGILGAAWLLFALVIPLVVKREFALPFIVLCSGLLLSSGLVTCRRSTIVAAAMRDLAAGLRERKSKLRVKPGGLLSDHIWIAIVFVPLVASIVSYSLGLWGWIAATFIGWIASAAIIANRMDRGVETYFLRFSDFGQPRFRAMLSRESSDPLQELELYGKMLLLEHQRKSTGANHGD